MQIILDKDKIKVSLVGDQGVTMTETISEDSALRYAQTLQQLANQLLEEQRAAKQRYMDENTPI